LNIYSAVTIYFYLDADRPAGQVSEPLKNEIKPGNTPRTNGQNPPRATLARGFAAGAGIGLEACMKN
jgi:hypothetical protein